MRKDLWIIGGVALLAFASWGVLRLTRPEPVYATVYLNSRIYAQVPLTEYQTITVDQGDGRINVIVIDQTGVRMESSTCPNQICVHQGTVDPHRRNDISFSNWIVCLPNGVSVELSQGEEVP